MKEIVIKIDDEVYKYLEKRIKFGMATEMDKIVWNGKVLPKGHGRLIEVTPRLEMYLSTFQSYTGIDEAPYEYADGLIRNADAVVEADKEEE